MKDWLTGCGLIPEPGGSAFDLFCKVHDYFLHFFSSSLGVSFDICVFYSTRCVLNAANDDESVATAGPGHRMSCYSDRVCACSSEDL